MKPQTPARRRFIKQVILGASALSLPRLNGLAGPAKERLGVALAGLGQYSADLLAPALQRTKYCYLAGIVTGTPAKAEQWQRQYGIPDRNIYDYPSIDKIASNPDIDVVYIVLPNALHAEYAIRAANAGKQVWCEKPMALTVNECEAMLKACRDNKVKLAIGYRMQHEPNTQAVIRFGKDRVYGPLKSISAAAGFYYNRTGHWRQKKSMGGGAMYDMGVYSLQAARYCSGEEPIAVTARQSTTRPVIFKDVDETMTFDLEFPGGIKAQCQTSFAMSMNSLRVNCEQGWYQLEPFQTYSGIRGSTSDGKTLDAFLNSQQARQMDDDAFAILHGQPLLAPGEEGLRDIRVVEAIFSSAKTGQRTVI
ncbi:Glucose-fructose oxidoreductase [Candidatus Methylobacter favarea]|uniref:Glucose-fructose oxidoreductase n=1 Tax=Candidatus Methylobacter favarea TaxID=2707345 RepID=A0A8S0WSK4_9GAMM|nr:Gfo/Idh/MocA family oxidoreductase [Candidatus Methylobacter favarea]CAA9892851.1 Glucose-fructose oxidoreductase [Candidatus Methylobacter favarea]